MIVALLRRPLPRTWSLAIALGLLVACAVLWLNAARLHVHFQYWMGRGPSIAVPWQRLDASMDEKALLAAVPAGQRCIAQDKARNGLGDRVCYAPVQAVDGVPAMTVAFFFERGRLAHAVVHVPWWSQHRAARALVTQMGMPEAMQDRAARGQRLVQWRVAHGLVEYNRDPGWNPLGWGAIFWTAPRETRAGVPAGS